MTTGAILKQIHSLHMNINISKNRGSFFYDKHDLELLEVIQKWIREVLKVTFFHLFLAGENAYHYLKRKYT